MELCIIFFVKMQEKFVFSIIEPVDCCDKFAALLNGYETEQ